LSCSILNLISSLNPAGGGSIQEIRQVTPHLAELGVESTVAVGFPCRVEALGPNASGYGYRSGLAAEHDVMILHGLSHYHGIMA
jgi:hypothetical protein